MRELPLPPVDPANLDLSLPRLATILGYPAGKEIEGKAREVLDEAGREFAAVTRVSWRAAALTIEERGRDGVSLEGGVALTSAMLSTRLEKAGQPEVVVAGLTLGAALDARATELDTAGRPDLSFFLDSMATCAMEVLSHELYVRVCDQMARTRRVALPRLAPGYGPWQLTDQGPLRRALGDESALPVSVLESGMLTPLRSTLVLFPLTENLDLARSRASLSACASCGALDCAYRRAERESNADSPSFVPKGEE